MVAMRYLTTLPSMLSSLRSNVVSVVCEREMLYGYDDTFIDEICCKYNSFIFYKRQNLIVCYELTLVNISISCGF